MSEKFSSETKNPKQANKPIFQLFYMYLCTGNYYVNMGDCDTPSDMC